MSSKESISVYPRLRFLDPGGGEELFEACAPTTVIGRSNDADVTLLDRLTSRRHAQIVKVGEGYSIEDLQSRHGTYVNGEKVDRCSLKHGDKIRVGGMELQFVAHPQDGTVSTWGDITAGDALKKSLAQLTSVMASVEPEGHSELEKVRCILDLQIHYVSLLPATLPKFSSFEICAISEPTHHVGGDFYDFLLPDAGQQLLGVLADVSGKGIPAALLSSMVQGALDGECRAGGSLGQILNNVNRLVLGRSRPQDFVTLFLFSIDAEGKGEYISAGHNPAYLFHASNGNIEELSSNTGILGMFDSLSFESLPLKLDTGDRLIVYSDGVTEATNPADEMFGSERLRKIISGDPSGGPRDLEQKVLESLEEFTEGMPQMDDVTLVVVQNGA